MPETFNIPDPVTGERRPTECLSLAEVAAEFHCSESYVRSQTDPRNGPRWVSHLFARRRWMTWDDIAAAWEAQTDRPPAVVGVPEASGPAKLGTPVSDVDLEPITKPVPDPEATS